MQTKYIALIAVIIAVVAVGGALTGFMIMSRCGNNVCDNGESSSSCCIDCGCPTGERCIDDICQNLCGNGFCDEGESSATCCIDCGCPSGKDCVNNICQTYCGNGLCESNENCDSCPNDCTCPSGQKCEYGVCVTYCGNGICDPDETQYSCCKDCGCPGGQDCINNACQTTCGDGICASSESSYSCCKDCGCPSGQQCINNACSTYCGNNKCDAGENYYSCPGDCPSSKFTLSLSGTQGWSYPDCYVNVGYTIANTGNKAATNTKLYLKSTNPSRGTTRTLTLTIGTINAGDTKIGTTKIYNECGGNIIDIYGYVYDTSGEYAERTITTYS